MNNFPKSFKYVTERGFDTRQPESRDGVYMGEAVIGDELSLCTFGCYVLTEEE